MKRLFPGHKNENGQAMVEYGIIVALVALVAISSLGLLGSRAQNLFQSAIDQIAPGQGAQSLDDGVEVFSEPLRGISVPGGLASLEPL